MKPPVPFVLDEALSDAMEMEHANARPSSPLRILSVGSVHASNIPPQAVASFPEVSVQDEPVEIIVEDPVVGGAIRDGSQGVVEVHVPDQPVPETEVDRTSPSNVPKEVVSAKKKGRSSVRNNRAIVVEVAGPVVKEVSFRSGRRRGGDDDHDKRSKRGSSEIADRDHTYSANPDANNDEGKRRRKDLARKRICEGCGEACTHPVYMKHLERIVSVNYQKAMGLLKVETMDY